MFTGETGQRSTMLRSCKKECGLRQSKDMQQEQDFGSSAEQERKKRPRDTNCADSKNCKCCEAERTENTAFTIARRGERKETN